MLQIAPRAVSKLGQVAVVPARLFFDAGDALAADVGEASGCVVPVRIKLCCAVAHQILKRGAALLYVLTERVRAFFGGVGDLPKQAVDLALEVGAGVLDARVHVALPDVDTLRLEGPVPRPRASVLLRHRGPASPLSPGDVRQLVAGAVQGMEPADVAVVALPVPAAPVTQAHVTGLGPFTVARRSVAGLQTLLAVLLCTNVLLAAGLAFAFARGRRGLPPPRDDANTPPGR